MYNTTLASNPDGAGTMLGPDSVVDSGMEMNPSPSACQVPHIWFAKMLNAALLAHVAV